MNDAVAIERLLRVAHGFHTVALLLNEDATKPAIEAALDSVNGRLREGTAPGAARVIVYFAGHGVKVGV